MAGKSGAHFKENGKEVNLKYEELFTADRQVHIPDLGTLSWYPNRDSLSYTTLYGLEDAPTFIRTTLRHPDFMYGWKNVIDLKLVDDVPWIPAYFIVPGIIITFWSYKSATM